DRVLPDIRPGGVIQSSQFFDRLVLSPAPGSSRITHPPARRIVETFKERASFASPKTLIVKIALSVCQWALPRICENLLPQVDQILDVPHLELLETTGRAGGSSDCCSICGA